MPLRIEVKGLVVEQKKWQKGERSGVINEQTECWCELPNGERRRVRIPVENEKSPYPVGVYLIHDDSFYIDQFGALGLARIKLVAVAAGAVEAPARTRVV